MYNFPKLTGPTVVYDVRDGFLDLDVMSMGETTSSRVNHSLLEAVPDGYQIRVDPTQLRP